VFRNADNTIVLVTTDNGTQTISWPDGGTTPFAGNKGLALEGGFRSQAILRWPGHVPAGKVDNSIISGLDWLPTFAAAAGYNGNIIEDLKKGKQFGDRTYKVHLDGYDQMDLITGKGPSNRHEIFYFTESTLGAVRVDDYKYQFIDQPNGWFGGTVKLDWPIVTNLRLDPFERMRFTGSLAYRLRVLALCLLIRCRVAKQAGHGKNRQAPYRSKASPWRLNDRDDQLGNPRPDRGLQSRQAAHHGPARVFEFFCNKDRERDARHRTSRSTVRRLAYTL
jgi:hypothetical protein